MAQFCETPREIQVENLDYSRNSAMKSKSLKNRKVEKKIQDNNQLTNFDENVAECSQPTH